MLLLTNLNSTHLKYFVSTTVAALCTGMPSNEIFNLPFLLTAGMLILLSSASGLWFGSYNLPLPGHVLIYGPPVSTT